MNDELDTFGGGDADLEHATGRICADEHVRVVEIEAIGRAADDSGSAKSDVIRPLKALEARR